MGLMGAHLFDLDARDVATTTDDWYTPRWVFDAAGLTFDMDVAAPVDEEMRTVPAKRYLTALDDGLVTPWEGVVWCNPPYSKATPWVDKWSRHPDGMILVPALPEVHWRGTVMNAADSFALLVVDFHRPDGSVARLRWPNTVARVAAADRFADGAYLVRPA